MAADPCKNLIMPIQLYPITSLLAQQGFLMCTCLQGLIQTLIPIEDIYASLYIDGYTL